MLDRTPTPRPLRIPVPRLGGSFAALEFGPQNRPIDVVFSHANSFSARTYRSILAPAAETMRILAYDLRGHGETDLPVAIEGREHGWGDFGADLVALLEALDLHDVVLAAHSMGATATLLAAAQAPERARALALFEPVIYGPPGNVDRQRIEGAVGRVSEGALRRRANFPSVEAAMETFVGRGAFAAWPEQFVADYAEGGLRQLADGTYALVCAPEWEASNYRTQPLDVWDALERAPRPIRILRGAVWSSAEIMTEYDRLTADRVSIETVPGVGHFLPMDRPDLVTATLRSLEA